MLNILLKNANIYFQDKISKLDLLVVDGVVSRIGTGVFADDTIPVIDVDNYYIFPGFADVHVHLREPGFFYKESIKTGTQAAARGGFTLVCSMPNLNPVPDTIENIKIQQDIIDNEAIVMVKPYASITTGEKGENIVDMNSLKDYCFAFSDDGKGVQNPHLMEKAMKQAKLYGKAIVAHCEDESLLNGGYIHDGEYARLHNHRGISSKSEYIQVERDLKLVEKTNVRYHVCHISTKETVDLIRQAKKKGLKVSCETAPHYLALCDMDIKEEGRFKMNPPIRSQEDKQALIEGVKDGTIEIIATDHAPHSAEEKSKGLEKSNMGVVGLETSFAAMNTFMVQNKHMSYEELCQIMSINPRKLFGLKYGINIGDKADFVLVDTQKKFTVNPENFVSKGKSTPFEGLKLQGDILMTVYDGQIIYKNEEIEL